MILVATRKDLIVTRKAVRQIVVIRKHVIKWKTMVTTDFIIIIINNNNKIIYMI